MGQSDSKIHIPETWDSAADQILRKGWRRMMVLGATDCGKSTFCRFLLTSLKAAGRAAALVDADTGQKDVGPPATVTLARPGCDLSNRDASEYYFVGDTSPVGLFLPLVVGTRRLVEAAGEAPVVIDTTGLLQGPGRALKDAQIASLRPDVLLALQRTQELETVLREHRAYPTIRLEISPKAGRKSPEKRRAAREAAFRIYFSGAQDTWLDIRRVVVQRAPIFIGKPVADNRFLYAEATPEALVAVSEQANRTPSRRLKLLPVGFEQGLLCGVADENDTGLGLSIIRRIDFATKRIRVHTRVAPERIRILQFGRLYLDPDGRELGVWRPPR